MAGLLGDPKTIPTGRGRSPPVVLPLLVVAVVVASEETSLRGRPRPEYTIEFAPMLTFRRRPAMVDYGYCCTGVLLLLGLYFFGQEDGISFGACLLLSLEFARLIVGGGFLGDRQNPVLHCTQSLLSTIHLILSL